MKIKASELRIGNLFYPFDRRNKTPFVVAEIKGHEVKAYPQDEPIHKIIKYSIFSIRDIEPILITEEILLKFGFELIYKSNYSITYSHINNHKFSYKFNVLQEKSWLEYYGGAIDCISAHKLQNIYFALTGEELIFND